MSARIGSLHLSPGDVVLTGRHTVGDDFGIPLVAPIAGRGRDGNRAVERTVRGRCHAQGGVVVWFTDGTKTQPLHGRTAWTTVGERSEYAVRDTTDTMAGAGR